MLLKQKFTHHVSEDEVKLFSPANTQPSPCKTRAGTEPEAVLLCSNWLIPAGKDTNRQDATPSPSLVYFREVYFTGDGKISLWLFNCSPLLFSAACSAQWARWGSLYQTGRSIVSAVAGELTADSTAPVPIRYFTVCTVVGVRLCTHMQLIIYHSKYHCVQRSLSVHTWSVFLVPKRVTLHLTIPKHSFMLYLSRDPDFAFLSKNPQTC